MNVINYFLDNNSFDILLKDTNGLLNILEKLTTSYLKVADTAQYLSNTSGASQEIINSALEKVNNIGSLIDITTLTLAGKLDFALDVLDTTDLPLDLVIAIILNFLNTEKDNNNLIQCDNLGIDKSKICKRQKKWLARQQKWLAKKFR